MGSCGDKGTKHQPHSGPRNPPSYEGKGVLLSRKRMHTARFLEYEAKLETQVSPSNLVLPANTYRLHGSGWLVPIYPLLTQRTHTHGLSLVRRPPASCTCYPGDLPIYHSCKTITLQHMGTHARLCCRMNSMENWQGESLSQNLAGLGVCISTLYMVFRP